MFSRVISAAISGVSIDFIHIETDISNGLPMFEMVGLLSSEVKESKERVRTSLKNSGIFIPPRRITVNLSPATIRKEGGAFDLPIAMGVLLALNEEASIFSMRETMIAGELSLDGRVNPICGVLPMVLEGRAKGIKTFFVPAENCKEAAVVEGVKVIGVHSLQECWNILQGKHETMTESVYPFVTDCKGGEKQKKLDFADIHGQEVVKRAAKIAAAGMHHFFMIGPPGCGKSMIAARIPGILPKPDFDECIEITKIHSIAGTLNGNAFLTERPFRAPHHTITAKALIGGGNRIKPGEITLAHRGVLFLDELAEFKRDTLDVLRQPLETGEILISRVNQVVRFPAQVMLVAASNPCKCGFFPDRNRCSCAEFEVKKYQSRMRGPIMDRIDICTSVLEVSFEQLQQQEQSESSDDIRRQIEIAVCRQKERYRGTNIMFNSQLNQEQLKIYCPLGNQEIHLLKDAFAKLGMSARAYYKMIRVARTIADLEESEKIREQHICEAIGYRTIF